MKYTESCPGCRAFHACPHLQQCSDESLNQIFDSWHWLIKFSYHLTVISLSNIRMSNIRNQNVKHQNGDHSMVSTKGCIIPILLLNNKFWQWGKNIDFWIPEIDIFTSLLESWIFLMHGRGSPRRRDKQILRVKLFSEN